MFAYDNTAYFNNVIENGMLQERLNWTNTGLDRLDIKEVNLHLQNFNTTLISIGYKCYDDFLSILYS